jgi:hypothetical protein
VTRPASKAFLRALESSRDKRERTQVRGYCTGPHDGAPAPGDVGLDRKASCCTCQARVAITVRGRYAHHKARRVVTEVSVATRPTRRDLLLVIGELQDIIGAMGSTYANDRAVDRAEPIQVLEKRGMELCVLARSFDPPISGAWPRRTIRGTRP